MLLGNIPQERLQDVLDGGGGVLLCRSHPHKVKYETENCGGREVLGHEPLDYVKIIPPSYV